MFKILISFILVCSISMLYAQDPNFEIIEGSPNYKEAPKEYQIWRLAQLGENGPQVEEEEERVYLMMPENPEATNRAAGLDPSQRTSNQNHKVQTFTAEPIIITEGLMPAPKVLTAQEIKTLQEAKKKKIEAQKAALNAPDRIPKQGNH